MVTELLTLDELPRQNASQVKNKWGEVLRLVRQQGCVAVTNHSVVETVLVDAARYRQLTEEIQVYKSREHEVLEELASRFDARLAALQRPKAAQKVQALFEAEGKITTRRPVAGTSY